MREVLRSLGEKLASRSQNEVPRGLMGEQQRAGDSSAASTDNNYIESKTES
jgi:hypothetical protein